MPVSVKDVAARAGVSPGTVSKVLNGRTSARASTEVQTRIRSVAKELGYRPNLVARSLVRQKTDTIGLMISELSNPFFVSVMKNIEDCVFKAGYQVLLDANSNAYGDYQSLHRISGWFVDGVLIWTTPFRDLARFLGDRARDIPVVYLGHLRDDGADAVAMDLYQAGSIATEHLLERGYKRPCFVSSYSAEYVFWPNNQIPAFQATCLAAGINPEILVLKDSRAIQSSGFQAGLEIAARPPSTRPDALVCHNDLIALFVYNGLVKGGLRVPEDIALLGFDGIEEGKYLPCGPLTTVRMPEDVLCASALDILLQRIAGDRETPPHQVLIPVDLIAGATT